MGNNGSQVNSTAVGVAVGFGILGILFTLAILQFFCKHKCKKWMKNCKKNSCKKKKPSLQDKMMTKMGVNKSPPPFNISSVIK